MLFSNFSTSTAKISILIIYWSKYLFVAFTFLSNNLMKWASILFYKSNLFSKLSNFRILTICAQPTYTNVVLLILWAVYSKPTKSLISSVYEKSLKLSNTNYGLSKTFLRELKILNSKDSIYFFGWILSSSIFWLIICCDCLCEDSFESSKMFSRFTTIIDLWGARVISISLNYSSTNKVFAWFISSTKFCYQLSRSCCN